jgi:hypothetical protein
LQRLRAGGEAGAAASLNSGQRGVDRNENVGEEVADRVTAVMMTTAIKAAMRPYSMAVTPD